jgi:hypothetical protein
MANILDKIMNFLADFWKKKEAPQEIDFAQPKFDRDKAAKRYYAEEMLKNPIYLEVIDRIEKDCIQKWRATPSEASDVREQYYLHLRVLKQIDQYFRSYVLELVTDQQQQRILRQV